jgi:hypothetical protein
MTDKKTAREIRLGTSAFTAAGWEGTFYPAAIFSQRLRSGLGYVALPALRRSAGRAPGDDLAIA